LKKISFCCLLSIITYLPVSAQLTEAVDFTLADTEGETYQLYDLLDQNKVVLLDFFFIACAPCYHSLPTIKSLWETYGSGSDCFYVLGLDVRVQESSEMLSQYKSNKGISYPLFASDTNNAQPNILCQQYSGGLNVPAFVVILPDRTVEYMHVGWGEEGTGLISAIDSIMLNKACEPTTINKLDQSTEEPIIYPNPTTELITVTNLPREATRINVYNVLGELVHSQQTASDDSLIDLSTLPSGLYIIQLQNRQMTFRKKVIKQ